MNFRHSLAAALVLFPFLGGCAGTVDVLTSQRFRDRPFRTIFLPDDEPIYVLRHVPVGDDRARAFREIKEPKKSGGNDELQNEVVMHLASGATADRQVICRLSAIEALARFDDPRASQILVTAYHNAAIDAPGDGKEPIQDGVVQAGRRVRQPFAPVSSFTPDQVVAIQAKALEALAVKRTPEASALLCEVASKPAAAAPKAKDLDPLAVGDLSQDAFDLRLTAIRALGSFKGDLQVAVVLHRIVTGEREPAPRNCAYESLKKVTGKSYPPMANEWRAFLKLDAAPNVPLVPPKK